MLRFLVQSSNQLDPLRGGAKKQPRTLNVYKQESCPIADGQT